MIPAIPEPRLDPPEGGLFPCPVCGELNPEFLIRNFRSEILGCNECLEQIEPEQYYDNRWEE